MTRLLGLVGVLVFLGFAYLVSSNRKAILWRTILGGLLLQVLFGVLVLKLGVGRQALSILAGAVKDLIAYSDRGSEFLFGYIVQDPEPSRFVFAFKVLPIVIFISSLFSCLYHLGVMQLVVLAMARVMTRLMGVSGAESLATAANVFMGQTEAPIIVAPYIPSMTFSELMALMTGGMATVSGAVLGGYIALGIPPEYLITASIMAAPASLMMAKMMVPETSDPATSGKVALKVEAKDANLIEAAARGAGQGLKLALNIAAMLIAFIAIIYLLNGIIGWVGRMVWLEELTGERVTFQLLLGFLLAPLAVVMGVPVGEATQVGQLIGIKVVLNEFLAFMELATIQQGLSAKSQLIATFALCGFANFSSVGIQLGGIGALAPSRRADLAKLGLRAVLGGSLASFTTAAIAGMLV